MCLLLNAPGPANYSGHKGTPWAKGKYFQSQERLLPLPRGGYHSLSDTTTVRSRAMLKDAVTRFPVPAAVSSCPAAHFRGAGSLPTGAPALPLLPALTCWCPHVCRLLFLHLWIQRQDLKANVLEHFQNPKINNTCHYKWSAEAAIRECPCLIWAPDAERAFCCCSRCSCSAFPKCHYENLSRQAARSRAQENQPLGSVDEADVQKDSSWKQQRTYRSTSSPTNPQGSGIKWLDLTARERYAVSV